ncbi:hypothetical protein H6G89_34145 [Oscillatoria sp. FACHB-1407]|uniref:hypothetical protein n=1 Tax=Oscillatoria sp. FACHB-1407 TaxID=2692847 RepID=UPI001683DCD1|nr:hypothetical protein [Oscillatoria sp. FACHB-1407]MBD2466029.1 hypothetical protein [Oscillatoria sp. FACHB-1407]
MKRRGVGDRICILQVPQTSLPPETRQLYEVLVREGVVLEVYAVDQWGYPVVEYCANDEDGAEHYHWLSIDEYDVWEQVS